MRPPQSSAIEGAAVDLLELYRWAVQDPETHAVVLCTMYERQRPGRHPLILREDFAGTCAESVAWVALKKGRHAIAIDLDETTLDWAQRRAARLLGARASDIEFVRNDVRMVGPPEVPHADVIAVLNFSILYWRQPEDLDSYLRHAFDGLASGGILVLNLFGGPATVKPGTTRHWVTPQPRLPSESPIAAFEYLWEVRSYDPASGRIDCRIHFARPDPEAPKQSHEIRDAFTYDWRLWSVDELVGACARAGFSDVQVWRHTYDASKGAAGVFLGPVEPESLLSLESWTAYIVAGKGSGGNGAKLRRRRRASGPEARHKSAGGVSHRVSEIHVLSPSGPSGAAHAYGNCEVTAQHG